MLKYKLTGEEGKTHNNTQWGPGVTHTASGMGELCGPGWVHVYSHPLVAVFLNPTHADFKNPKLWECECGGAEKHDLGLKSGYSRVTTVREIEVPEVTLEDRVGFGILCALEVYGEKGFVEWAERWLTGENRTVGAAETAAGAAETAAGAAAWAAEAAARAAAGAAAWEVWAAARVAAGAADWAAWAAARAADWAARAAGAVDFVVLARKAVDHGR